MLLLLNNALREAVKGNDKSYYEGSRSLDEKILLPNDIILCYAAGVGHYCHADKPLCEVSDEDINYLLRPMKLFAQGFQFGRRTCQEI